MPELVIKHQLTSGTSWPAEAALGEQNLVFSESIKLDDVRQNLIKASANHFWEQVFLNASLIGIVAIVLHLIVPLGNLWLEIFLISLLLNWIIWIKRLNQADSSGKVVDVAFFFTRPALKALRQALVNSRHKQASELHLLLELTKIKAVRKTLEELGIDLKTLPYYIGAFLDNAAIKPPAITPELASVPFLAYRLKTDLRQVKITPNVLLGTLFLQDSDSPAKILLSNLGVTWQEFLKVMQRENVEVDVIDNAQTNFQSNVAGAVNQTLSQMKNKPDKRSRPLASFLFVGSNIVQKELVARILADTEYGLKESFMEIDLGDRSTALNSLLGDGFQPGALYVRLGTKPAGVIHFKNFEKTHNEIQDFVAEALSTGFLNKRIDLSNSIVVVSSTDSAWEFVDRFDRVIAFNMA